MCHRPALNKISVHVTRIAALFACTAALSACSGSAPNNLGIYQGHLRDCPASPNCVSSQAHDSEHQIAPLPLQATALLDYPVHPVWDALARHCAGTIAGTSPTLPRELLRRGWQQRLRALRGGARPEAVAEPAALALLWRSWRSARQVAGR